MLKIPYEVVMERWDSLPLSLREAIFSEENGAFVWQVGEEIGLSENRITILATLIGDVLRGFIDYSFFRKSLSSDLSLSEEVSSSVFNKINDRIFKPLEEDIKNSYSPYNDGSASAMPNSAIEATPQTPQNETVDLISLISSNPLVEPITPAPIPVIESTPIVPTPAPAIKTSSTPEMPSAAPMPEAAPVEAVFAPAPDALIPSFSESASITPEMTDEPAIIDSSISPVTAPFIVVEQEAIRPILETDPSAGLSPLRPSFWEGDPSAEDKNVFVKLEFGPKIKKDGDSQSVSPENVVDLKKLP